MLLWSDAFKENWKRAHKKQFPTKNTTSIKQDPWGLNEAAGAFMIFNF